MRCILICAVWIMSVSAKATTIYCSRDGIVQGVSLVINLTSEEDQSGSNFDTSDFLLHKGVIRYHGPGEPGKMNIAISSFGKIGSENEMRQYIGSISHEFDVWGSKISSVYFALKVKLHNGQPVGNTLFNVNGYTIGSCFLSK
jgi:hypothetical protein